MNIINRMTPHDKLTKLMEYKQKNICDFGYSVDMVVERPLKMLDNPNVYIGKDEILHLLEEITKIDKSNPECLNILYDKKINCIMIYMNQKWDMIFFSEGVNKVMSMIKERYLDKYEMYLIKKTYDHANIEKGRDKHFLNCLEEYFRLVANFDLVPYIVAVEETDKEIVGWRIRENNDHFLVDHFTQEYDRIKNNVKRSEKTEIRTRVANIITRNHVMNIDTLNKAVFELIEVDSEFGKFLS